MAVSINGYDLAGYQNVYSLMGQSQGLTHPQKKCGQKKEVQITQKKVQTVKEMDTEKEVQEEKKMSVEKTQEERGVQTESVGGSVGVNVSKRMRQIAAAKTKAQLQAVLAILRTDLRDCENGVKNGMCDQSEVNKVKGLIEMANQHMGEVKDREATPEEESAFAMASMM